MVQIRDNQTGQIINVDPQNLGQYGLTMPSPTAQSSIPQPQPTPSIGGFVGNAGQDIGNNISGLLKLPGLLGGILTGKVDAGKTGKDIATGLFNEYKGLVVNPQTNKLDITQPIKSLYNKPVSTIMDVLPFLQAGKLALAGKTAEIGKATDMAATAGNIGGNAATAGSPLDILGNAGILPKNTSPYNMAARTFSNAFTLPEKAAQRLNPLKTSQQLLDYGVTGGFDNLSKTADAVTGQNGILNKIVQNSAANIKTNIPVDNVLTSTKNLLDSSSEIDDALGQKINSNIIKILGTPQEANGALKANDALQSIRDLEQKGYSELKKSTMFSKNPKAEEVGNIYLSAADELKNSLDQVAQKENVISTFKSPDVINRIKQISPKLAEDFQNTKSLQDIRSLQAPFVRLKQMIDLSQNSGQSTVARTGERLGGAVAGGAIGGVPGAIIGGIAAPVADPIIQGIIQGSRVPIATKTASAMNKVGNAASKAAPIIGQGSKVLSSILNKTVKSPMAYNVGRQTPSMSPVEQNNQPQTNQNIQDNGSHTNNISQITPDMLKRAYLELPAAQAARVKSAYDAQFGGLNAGDVQAQQGIKNVAQNLKNTINGSDINQGKVLLSNVLGPAGAGDPNIQKFQAEVGAFNQSVATILHRRGMSDQQFARLTPSFPDPSKDSKQQMLSKISGILDLLNTTYSLSNSSSNDNSSNTLNNLPASQ